MIEPKPAVPPAALMPDVPPAAPTPGLPPVPMTPGVPPEAVRPGMPPAPLDAPSTEPLQLSDDDCEQRRNQEKSQGSQFRHLCSPATRTAADGNDAATDMPRRAPGTIGLSRVQVSKIRVVLGTTRNPSRVSPGRSKLNAGVQSSRHRRDRLQDVRHTQAPSEWARAAGCARRSSRLRRLREQRLCGYRQVHATGPTDRSTKDVQNLGIGASEASERRTATVHWSLERKPGLTLLGGRWRWSWGLGAGCYGTTARDTGPMGAGGLAVAAHLAELRKRPSTVAVLQTAAWSGWHLHAVAFQWLPRTQSTLSTHTFGTHLHSFGSQ